MSPVIEQPITFVEEAATESNELVYCQMIYTPYERGQKKMVLIINNVLLYLYRLTINNSYSYFSSSV